MMRRLESGFRRRFRSLLILVRPRRLEFGVELLLGRARERSVREGQPLAEALAAVYLFTQQRVFRRLAVTGACTRAEAPWSKLAAGTPSFLCDESLGGLARWLRAGGYEAQVRHLRAEPRSLGRPGPDALLAEAAARALVLLTSVDDLLDRRLVREGRVLALWVPTGLEPTTQLHLVLADLGLGLREPRCMACGGELEARAKEAVAERIPPRTARWKDDYWTCLCCGRLFWKGTHWERIARALSGAAGAGARAA
jgi:uncharacterized protein with PIN domain